MAEENEGMKTNEEWFLAYLDGELTPEEMDQLEGRLKEDQALKDEFDQYKRTVELVRKVGPAHAPTDLLPNIQRRLARRQERSYDMQLRFPYELLVFVALLVGILYMYFVMVPAGPGEVAFVIKVETSSPLTPETTQQFSLTKVEREGKDTVFTVRLDRQTASSLLKELKSVAAQLPELPDGVRLFEVRIRVLDEKLE